MLFRQVSLCASLAFSLGWASVGGVSVRAAGMVRAVCLLLLGRCPCASRGRGGGKGTRETGYRLKACLGGLRAASGQSTSLPKTC